MARPGGFSIAGYNPWVRVQWLFRATYLPESAGSALPRIRSLERCTNRKFPSGTFSYHPDVGSPLREIRSFPSRQPGYLSRAGEYLLCGRSPQSGVPTTLNIGTCAQSGSEVLRGAMVRLGEGGSGTLVLYPAQHQGSWFRRTTRHVLFALWLPNLIPNGARRSHSQQTHSF